MQKKTQSLVQKKKKWEIIERNANPDLFTPEDVVSLILKNRGYTTADEIHSYLHPTLADVTIDAVGIDREALNRAKQRILEAIEQKEKIIVYGDYDVDGITGSAILWETLHALKANTLPYLPHRIDEGYGLSIKGITNLRELHPDIKLIITVDNGIVAHDAVAFANKHDIEVIITDHHVSAGEESVKPDAYAVIHTTKLCGAGVAYLLSQELKPTGIEEDHLIELAALGTIADLVPLTGANRTIVKYGLDTLRKTKRKGLQALFVESEIDPTSIGVYQVGHQIGPRLNATGRMESAMDSLRLLCTKDENRAQKLAGLLGRVNKERQQVMITATEHASLSVKNREVLKKMLIVNHDTYPEGVIGLVAGRLVEEYYRPSIVISKGEKTSKGSVRSISGFNIIEFLRQSADYFVNVGGHPMAAGFTVETEKIAELTDVLEKLAEKLVGEDLLIRTLKIDTELPLSVVTNDLYRKIQTLHPFGMGNPEPVFMSTNVEVKDTRLLGKEGKHLRLVLQQDFGSIIEAVAFGMGDWYATLTKGDFIDVAYTIDENTWQGNTKLQLKIKDIKKNP